MKYIGALIIIVCAYAYGIYASKKISQKQKLCKTALSVLKNVRSEVERKTPTEQILLRLQKYLNSEKSFKNTLDVIEYFKDISDEPAGEICVEFFSVLGKTSTEIQKNELDFLIERMSAEVENKEQKTKTDSKLCRVLPMFFALLLIIILI